VAVAFPKDAGSFLLLGLSPPQPAMSAIQSQQGDDLTILTAM
jgi:hypothetical protein